MGLTREALRSLPHAIQYKFKSKSELESELESQSAQIHKIRLFKEGLEPTRKFIDRCAEYEPQSPRSIITLEYVRALQGKINVFPLGSNTFQDRHQVLYIPIGTVFLRWRKYHKLVTTEFYVVDMLAPQYDRMNVDVVLGGANVDASLLDERMLVGPIFLKKLSKAQEEKQREEKKRKEQKIIQAVKEEEAAEKRQRDAERQARLRQQQQQSSSSSS